jgi:hypothetical protein
MNQELRPHTPAPTKPEARSLTPEELERVYDDDFDIGRVPEAQREQFMKHALTAVSPPRHFGLPDVLTLRFASSIYVVSLHGMLPRIKQDDFHGIGGRYKAFVFLFPLVRFYGRSRVYLRLVDRLNFQYRLRGLPSPIDRQLVERWIRRSSLRFGLFALVGGRRSRFLKEIAKAVNRLAVTEGVPAQAQAQAGELLEPGETVKLAVSGGPHNRLASLITLPFALMPEPIGGIVEAVAEMIVGLHFRHRHALLTDRHIYVMRAKYFFGNFRTDRVLGKFEVRSAHAELVGSALLGRALDVDGWKVYPRGWGNIGIDVARAMATAVQGERSSETPSMALPSLQ